ncbi:MAG: twin-arginine translocase TatA/TatE family subunit [Chloroflexi bacterium]|jgi:sec-independent protein translocase protein TatA|nr:twin-arginine translocase TatA/TatE family subunit [Chloroflexota bacterium]HLG50439.1 twin-arginine translocase TatA/TatE family subunit [Chloroflexota bacterium]
MGVGIVEPWHLVLILIIALVIFGPGKLGDVGGALGRGIREFKSSINAELDDDKKPAKSTETAASKETSEKAS